ncbi:alcohol dehydrogenase catalytic domain-containing protein [Halosegnis rubeus]|jgi:alcohol dehydrogenase|uniref:Alcohol dehydrogenase catalytic domain-containing protein n=1 Tax=Halosegnis rubeus TaxID=2212850 RepID=A0A5N5UBB9_9EURY|nr:zinc-dependent alcohol dehydrogenase family protein [Halosegnis rubeus]KAB7515936.1 alcohol dehydrogenase catalytic domain-containing protein [Halosegnis rubeus]
MRAGVLREYGEPLDVTTRPDPTPDADGAVVAVEACGICRSDWHAWQGHGEWADDQAPLDYVLGHEPAGRVVETGPDVTGFSVGDRVVVPFSLGCGACSHCYSDHGNTCPDGLALGFERPVPGAFAEQVAVPNASYNLQPIPDGVSFRDVAAVGCRYMTAFHTLAHRADISGGDWVAVHGCGGVGLSTVQIADALGARAIAVDVDPEALARAERAGAVATVESDPVEAIRDITHGGADVSVDALGRAETARNSVRCLRERGTHAQVGLTTEAEKGVVSLPTDWMTRWEIDWLGARGMPPTRFGELLSMVESGHLDPGSLVGREVSLDSVSERLAAMSTYDTDGIEVLTF